MANILNLVRAIIKEEEIDKILYNKSYTLLAHLVMLTNKYPELNNIIRNIATPEEINKIGIGDFTALHYACFYYEYSTIETLRILLENGANVNMRVYLSSHKDALHALLFESNSFEPVKLLLEYGANVNEKYYGNRFSNIEDPRTGKLLLEYDAKNNIGSPDYINIIADNIAQLNRKT